MQKSVEEMFEAAYKYASHYKYVGICDIDDLVQIAMVKMIKRNPMPATQGWLFKTMHSVVCDAARKTNGRQGEQFISGGAYIVREQRFQDADDRIQNIAARRDEVEIDLLPQLKNVLAKLSSPLRVVLVLHSEGYSYEEIASLTNTKIGTVRSRLFHARKRARQLLPEII